MTACAGTATGRLPVNTVLGCLAALAFSACGQVATLASFSHTWPLDAVPQAGADPRVTAFANGVDHPQWLYVLRNTETIPGSPANDGKPPPVGTGATARDGVWHLTDQAGSVVWQVASRR